MRLGDTLEAAHDALRAMLGRGRPKHGPTLADARAAFLAGLAGRVERGEASRHTLATRASNLRRLGGLEGLPLGELTPQRAAAWAFALEVSEVSRRGMVSSLKALTGWAAQTGMIAGDPLEGWNVARGRPRRRPLPTDAEVDRVIGAASPSAAVLFRFLADTGARYAEARAITVADVQADVVTLAKWKCGHSTGRPRTIYLPGRWPAVLAGLAVEHPTGPLLRRPDGQPWGLTCGPAAWYRVAGRVGVACHLYSLRHRSITRDLLAGESLAVVAALHGTSAREIERTYSHVTSQAEALRAAVRRRAG